MGFSSLLPITDISSSGLAAERLRMEVIANNIANAHTTRGVDGTPFRRNDVIFSAKLADASKPETPRGVQVVEVRPDASELPRVYRPGHPDADRDGFLTLPNVKIANEMVDLITASRGYEANLRVLRSFREMFNNTLDLLRGA